MVVIIYNRKKQVFLSFLKLIEKVMIEKVIVAFLFYGACEHQNNIKMTMTCIYYKKTLK